MNSRRHSLAQEIYGVVETKGYNKMTMAFLLASMTDKALTKFHKKFMEDNK